MNLIYKEKEGFFIQLFLIKVEQNQGGVGYLAPDCKALPARIGAVSLPQPAWVLQYEQTCKCFAARCLGILQGHSSHAQGLRAARKSPPFY